MSTTAKTFRNRENYAKYLALYFEPGVTVLLTTLEWCYKGQLPIKDHLADLGATNSLRKTNIINANEQNTFVELKEGKTELNNLDVTILYKVIQLTCDLSCNTSCPKDCQLHQLKKFLKELKDGRNSLAHPNDEHKNITDSMVEDKCEEMKDLLTKILQAAAFKGTIPPIKLREVLVHIQDDVQRISSSTDNICDSMRPYTTNLILADLKSKAFSNDELNSSLMNEMKEYSAPSLKRNDDLRPLKDILQLNNSPVIVVQGEAGRGKTTMSRFIYYSWLSGNTDAVEGLSSFDVVLRVECNRIFNSDINMFYETLFPNASFAFSNTNSLKRSLDKFKVFWIMDGFDESTAGFKGFLTAMTNHLSDKHKLLITTRPNIYKDLKKIICKSKLSMTSLALGLFQDRNVKDIFQSLLIDDENKKTFNKLYDSLGDDAKYLLRNPLNLKLYIELWIQDPKLVSNTYTTKMLFLKTIRNNLTLLKDRLYNDTSLFNEELKGFLEKWFYGSLCKQSFLMLTKRRCHIIDTEFLEILKKDAVKYDLKPSTCLSTFLVKEKEIYWRSDKEFRYSYPHLTQQYVLACLYLRQFKDYDGERLIREYLEEIKSFEFRELLTFYIEMFNEDGALDSDSAEVFSPIQLISGLIDDIDKQGLFLSTSVAANFNAKYMEKVSQVFKDVPLLLDIIRIEGSFPNFVSFSDLIKFMEFVQTQKIDILCLEENAWKEGFLSLIDFLIKSKIEIKLEGYLYRINDSSSVFGTDLNVTTLRANRRKYMKRIQRGRESEDLEEFSRFCESLSKPENQTIEQLEIWIKIDSYCNFADFNVTIASLPEEVVEITFLGIMLSSYIEKENFEVVLKFLNKIKGDKTVKFKALCHSIRNISDRDGKETYIDAFFARKLYRPTDVKTFLELHKRILGNAHSICNYIEDEYTNFDAFLAKDKRLLEIAHSVSDDAKNQWCKICVDLFKDVNLNLTDFEGTMDALDLLSNHHANLKTISLKMKSEQELFRMLTFLHNNKTRLSEVELGFAYLLRWKIKLILDKIRALGNEFTIPKELVMRTSIKMYFDTDQDDFQDCFTFLKHVKGDETLKFKSVYWRLSYQLTLEQQKILLDQITSKLNVKVADAKNSNQMCDEDLNSIRRSMLDSILESMLPGPPLNSAV